MGDQQQTATSAHTNSSSDDVADTVENTETIVVLRHIGGLSAGNMLGLHAGRYEFGPTIGQSGGLSSGKPSVIGFELKVTDHEDIILTPRDVEVMIDGQMASGPHTVTAGQVIQAGADYFSLGKPDNFLSLAQRDREQIKISKVLQANRRKVLPIPWLLFLVTFMILGIVIAIAGRPIGLALSLLCLLLGAFIWRSRSKKNKRALVRHEADITKAKTRLSESLASERNLVARQCRAAHASPTSLINEIADAPQEAANGQLPVGLCDITWNPPVEHRDDAGWDYQAVVGDFSSLPGVPFLLSANSESIVIKGETEATAAVSRYIDRITPRDLSGAPSISLRSDDGSDTTADTTIIIIKENGLATAESGTGVQLGAFVPHGIPESGARITDAERPGATAGSNQVGSLPDSDTVIDLTDSARPLDFSAGLDAANSTGLVSTADGELKLRSAGRLQTLSGVHLFTSDDRTESKQVLSTLGLELAEQRDAAEMSITILDAGDRGLIRLKQLPHCVEYAAIDDDSGARRAMAGLDSALAGSPDKIQVILVSEFPRLLAFLRLSGRSVLANQLDELAQRPGNADLIFVGSATTNTSPLGEAPSPIQDMDQGVARLQQQRQLA